MAAVWRQYVPPKHWSTQQITATTTHKTAFFIVTAVKTSTLKNFTVVQYSVTKIGLPSKNQFHFLDIAVQVNPLRSMSNVFALFSSGTQFFKAAPRFR
jgi:Ulp1 family protease